MYPKVWFPGISYTYTKCIPKFDFLEKCMLITTVFQSLISQNMVSL